MRFQGWGLGDSAVDVQEIVYLKLVLQLLSTRPVRSERTPLRYLGLNAPTLPWQHCGRQKLLRRGRRPGKGHGSSPQEPLASSPRHGSSIWRSLNGPKRDPGVRASSDHLAPLWSGLRRSAHTQTPASLFLIGWCCLRPNWPVSQRLCCGFFSNQLARFSLISSVFNLKSMRIFSVFILL